MILEGQRGERDAILVCPIARTNSLFFKWNLRLESNCPFGPQVANLDSIKGQERGDTVFRCMYRESSFRRDDKWNEAQGCKLSSNSPEATSYRLPASSFSSSSRFLLVLVHDNRALLLWCSLRQASLKLLLSAQRSVLNEGPEEYLGIRMSLIAFSNEWTNNQLTKHQ